MPKNKDLTPELKAIFDLIEEGGEQGIGQGELFDKLGKDYTDRDTLMAVMTNLGELREMGYIHRKLVEERTERRVITSIRWFVVGKGESVKEGTFPSFLPG